MRVITIFRFLLVVGVANVVPGHKIGKSLLDISQHIVGGNEVAPHSLPHQVALFIVKPDGTFLCGGSLISTKFILTAAHCLTNVLTVEALLGAHNIKIHEPSQKSYNVKKFILHENWDPKTVMNDIALIELPEPVKLNAKINTIALPSKSLARSTFIGRISTISGWGITSDRTRTPSDVLRQADTEVISNQHCALAYANHIKKTHICTSGADKKSSCGGDSGGPLVSDNKQIGVVSFGLKAGCEKGYPAVFTRVTEYLTWIAEHSDAVIN